MEQDVAGIRARKMPILEKTSRRCRKRKKGGRQKMPGREEERWPVRRRGDTRRSEQAEPQEDDDLFCDRRTSPFP